MSAVYTYLWPLCVVPWCCLPPATGGHIPGLAISDVGAKAGSEGLKRRDCSPCTTRLFSGSCAARRFQTASSFLRAEFTKRAANYFGSCMRENAAGVLWIWGSDYLTCWTWTQKVLDEVVSLAFLTAPIGLYLEWFSCACFCGKAWEQFLVFVPWGCWFVVAKFKLISKVLGTFRKVICEAKRQLRRWNCCLDLVFDGGQSPLLDSLPPMLGFLFIWSYVWTVFLRTFVSLTPSFCSPTPFSISQTSRRTNHVG